MTGKWRNNSGLFNGTPCVVLTGGAGFYQEHEMIDLSRDLERLTDNDIYKLGRAMQYSQSTGNPSLLVGGLLSVAMAEARRRIGDENAAEHRIVYTNAWEDVERRASIHALRKLVADNNGPLASYAGVFKKMLNHLSAELSADWN